MYIVVIGWVYVIGMLSLGANSLAAGLSMFVGVGLVPVVLLAYLARLRSRRRE